MGINARWIINWIERMTKKHGSAVYEKNRGACWDWGQAIAREQYGKNWNVLVPYEPTIEDIQRAKDWENGDVPSWVDQKRMIV